MFYVIYPEPMEILGKLWKCWKILDFFWKISNYNFQSRRQIMTARGVYWNDMIQTSPQKYTCFITFFPFFPNHDPDLVVQYDSVLHYLGLDLGSITSLTFAYFALLRRSGRAGRPRRASRGVPLCHLVTYNVVMIMITIINAHSFTFPFCLRQTHTTNSNTVP